MTMRSPRPPAAESTADPTGPPAGGCCGAATTQSTVDSPTGMVGPCCGTATEAHAEGRCCGAAARERSVADGAGCCD